MEFDSALGNWYNIENQGGDQDAEQRTDRQAAKAQEELNNAESAAGRIVGLTQELEKKNQKLRETEATIKALKTATDFS